MKTLWILLLSLFSISLFASKSERISDIESRIISLERKLSALKGEKFIPTPKPIASPTSVPVLEDEPRGVSPLPMVSLPFLSEVEPEEVEKESQSLDLNQRTQLLGSTFPMVEELAGQVTRFQSETKDFVPVLPGYEIKDSTLFVAGSGSELILSFPGRMAARVSENSRIVIGPEVEGRYELELRNGTVSALLDPERDLSKDPSFAIRTFSGVTEAVGTYYAVTEYNGQSYTKVNKGEVKKKTTPPTEPDFSAYLSKNKPTASSKK